ncbi:adrenodoxin-like protein 2, mitochondrial [Capsicum chacoense]
MQDHEVLLVCSTCHVIVMDVVYYNKLEDPTEVEYDMLDLDFGMTYTYIYYFVLSRLACQVIAIPELGRIWLALPVYNETTVDGYKLKPYYNFFSFHGLRILWSILTNTKVSRNIMG